MRIDPEKLKLARVRLMSALNRHVTWREFSSLIRDLGGDYESFSHHTVSHILNGRSAGSLHTAHGIVQMMRAHGVSILAEDLLENQEQIYTLR